MFKVLLERTGILFSITTKNRAYFFFISTAYIGMKVAPTTDPYPGVVEVCGYDIPTIISNREKLGNIRHRSRAEAKSFSLYGKIAA